MLLAFGMTKINCWHKGWERYVGGIRYGKDMLLVLGMGKICCWY